jgi:hypothetical protein
MRHSTHQIDTPRANERRVPLFRVWSDYPGEPWPELLGYWGLPNLQVIKRDVYVAKCAIEAWDRRPVAHAG